MTQREFFTMVNTIANGETPMDAEGNVVNMSEIGEFALAQIEKIDIANEKKKEKQKEKSAENQPLIDALTAALTDTPKTASELKDVIEASVQKTSSLLRGMVNAGIAKSCDMKGAKGTCKGYSLA